jgi:hypothetical protein
VESDIIGSGHTAGLTAARFRRNQSPSEFQPKPRHTIKPSKIRDGAAGQMELFGIHRQVSFSRALALAALWLTYRELVE